MQLAYYLITNGNIGQITEAMIVDDTKDLGDEVCAFASTTGTPLDEIVVNPVFEPIDWEGH